MHNLFVSKKKTKAYCGALFLVGLAILSYLNQWWPGIMLVIGIPLALRQFFLGRYYDMGMTLIVFMGVFFVSLYSQAERFFLPVIFIVGAIYLLFREYFEGFDEPEDRQEEDLNEEIEESQHDSHSR